MQKTFNGVQKTELNTRPDQNAKNTRTLQEIVQTQNTMDNILNDVAKQSIVTKRLLILQQAPSLQKKEDIGNQSAQKTQISSIKDQQKVLDDSQDEILTQDNNLFKLPKNESDLQQENRIQLIKFLQRKCKVKILSKLFKTQLKRSRYRKNVIKELLQTELNYIQDITILQEKIIIPMIDLIKDSSLQKLFLNIQSILTVNKGILEALREQFNVFTVYQTTMRVMVDKISSFTLYFDYCFSFDEFQITLENLIRDIPRIERFFAQIKISNTLKGSDISSYLIKPIQRLPLYVLLFKDLLKHTDEDHPDFKNINQCCDEFMKINTINNQNIGKILGQRQQIIVKVTGTEQKNSPLNQVKKHTIYITEVRIDDILINIIVRYKQIAELEELINKKFPKIKIPHFATLQWSNTHSPKIIEERRILIEEFLQIVLCSDLIKTEPELILSKLSLPQNFYSLTDLEKTKSQASEEYDTSSLKPSTTRLINNNLNKLGVQKNSLKQPNKTKIFIGGEAEQSEYLLYLHLMTGEEFMIGFEKSTLLRQVKDEIAKYICLQTSNDFKIYSIDNSTKYRLLEEDEVISNNLNCRNPKNDLLNKQQNQNYDKITLVLRKYIFLSWDLEQQDFRDDPVRFRLIIFQLIDEIKNEKYILNNDQYCFFTAAFIFIKSLTDEPQNILLHIQENQDIVQQVIPAQLLKSQSKTFWLQKIIDIYQQLTQQIRKIQENNKLLNIMKNSQCVVDKKKICQLIVLNALKLNPLCSMTLFYVQCPKDTIQKHKKNNLECFINIYISLNYQGLHLLSPTKELFKSYDYKQVQDLQCFTQEITIRFDQYEDELTFLTLAGHEIKALLEQYRMLNDSNYKIE